MEWLLRDGEDGVWEVGRVFRPLLVCLVQLEIMIMIPVWLWMRMLPNAMREGCSANSWIAGETIASDPGPLSVPRRHRRLPSVW